MTDCPRTEGIVAALLDEGRLSEADAAHVRSCQACRSAAARVRRFTGALDVAARAIAVEPLPPELLRIREAVPTVAPRADRFAAAIAAVLIVALAAGITLPALVGVAGPGEPGSVTSAPPESPAPVVLRSEDAVAGELTALGYACHEAVVNDQASPPIDGLLCKPSTAGLLATAIVIERAPDGSPATLMAKAGSDGVMDELAERTAVEVLDLALRVAVLDEADTEAARAWLATAIPATEPGMSRSIDRGGLRLWLVRDEKGGLLLRVTGVP